MKKRLLSLFLLIPLAIQQARADDARDIPTGPLSVSALKELVVAPRIYSVAAYVIEKYDACPPCPPNAVCETCVFGIYVADENHPRKPEPSTDDGLYLPTDKAKEFQIGRKYLFRIRYRLEKSPAGAWRQTGPELIHFDPLGRADKGE